MSHYILAVYNTVAIRKVVQIATRVGSDEGGESGQVLRTSTRDEEEEIGGAAVLIDGLAGHRLASTSPGMRTLLHLH
jgi:hypothetical protein